MQLIKNITIGIIVLGISSCAYMAREMVAPNQCQKCQVIAPDGSIVWEEEDCGGGVANMEDRCKIAAYDLGCDYVCSCETYRKDPEDEEE